jgi:hypothetical protein
MKRRREPLLNTVPSTEEYRLFADQPATVLQQYSVTKKSMALGIPVCACITVFHIEIALVLALAGGLIAFLLLYKKYGVKGAAAPGICALAGVLIGRYLIHPLIQYAAAIQEVYHGN